MIFIKLILAHLISDFLLQPQRWISNKEQYKIRSRSLYAHVMIHGLLTLLVLGEFTYWIPVLCVMVSHFIIDVLKVYRQKPTTKYRWFMWDQSLHIVALWFIYAVFFGTSQQFSFLLFSDKMIIHITASYFLTQPTAAIMRNVIQPWTNEIDEGSEASLAKAGRFIGMLERLFIYAFIFAGRWEAIGFLLAAKSVFRFGDLRESKNRKLTEYILIGTLLSFGIAMLVGGLSGFIIDHLIELK